MNRGGEGENKRILGSLSLAINKREEVVIFDVDLTRRASDVARRNEEVGKSMKIPPRIDFREFSGGVSDYLKIRNYKIY